MHLNIHVSKLSILDRSGAAGSYMCYDGDEEGVENILGKH